jgi:hypothetical protein
VIVIAFAVVRVAQGRYDWVTAAGWCTVALLASLSWLMPWYVIWILPLAAVVASVRLRAAALVFTVFLVLTFMPLTGTVLQSMGVNALASPVGHAAAVFDEHLAS